MVLSSKFSRKDYLFLGKIWALQQKKFLCRLFQKTQNLSYNTNFPFLAKKCKHVLTPDFVHILNPSCLSLIFFYTDRLSVSTIFHYIVKHVIFIYQVNTIIKYILLHFPTCLCPLLLPHVSDMRVFNSEKCTTSFESYLCLRAQKRPRAHSIILI